METEAPAPDGQRHDAAPDPASPEPPKLRFDLILAIVLTLATAFWGDLFGRAGARPDYQISVLTSIGIVLPLALRRHRPLVMLAIITVAAAAQTWFVATPTWSLIAIPMAAYGVARWVAGRNSRLVLVGGALFAVLAPLRWVTSGAIWTGGARLITFVGPLAALCLAWVIIPYLLGRRDRESAIIRHERQQAAAERHQSELTQREQQTRMAEATVRNEIARELHDVVAHSLSVIVVQADGGKALARKHPEAAPEVLETISRTGREALGEMRRIVGVLRADPDATDQAEYRPVPGLSDIATLVAKAPDRVQLSITGNQPVVSAALGVTAYRIVQEGITNFLKHAGPQAHATVAVVYQPGSVNIEVADDGDPAQGERELVEVSGPGYGLTGMQERVSAMGGELVAGPRPDGGWVVRASLPVAAVGVHRISAIGDNGAKHETDREPHE